ncbi:MAG TPA: sigma-70 domain-containing protein [Streptosporangiaceae bacterium]
MHVPRRLQELRARIRAATGEFIEGGIADPTYSQLAAHLDMDEEEIREACKASNAYSCLSLDAPIAGTANPDNPALGDTLGNDDAELDKVVDLQALRELLTQLPEREKTIVLLRFTATKRKATSPPKWDCPRCTCPAC